MLASNHAIGTSFLCILVAPFLALATASQGVLASSRPSMAADLRIMSFNVRYDSKPDSISVQQSLDNLSQGVPSEPVYYTNTSEQPWSLRRLYVANDILFNKVDLFGGQELLKRQVDDLNLLLGDGYKWIGIGRNDAKEAGEYAAIFYKTSSVVLNSWDTFWLSTTPFEPSKFAGAGSYRVCTTAHFTTTATKQNFTMLNTHLDEQSAEQRALGLSLVLHRAKYEAITTGNPVILMGDFNSPPSDQGYQIITGAESPKQVNETFRRRFSWSSENAADIFDNFAMRDLLGQVEPRYRVGGNYATFTGFQPDVGNSSEFSRIDYIMAGSNGGWKVLEYRVGNSLSDDGVYHSDHRPVIADIRV